MQVPEAPSTSLKYGKGIYLTDCFSRAALASMDLSPQAPTTQKTLVFLVEAALGEMHKAFEPEPDMLMAPGNCHSVYGVGAQKPDIRGLIDLNSAQPGFAIDEAAMTE